MKHTEEQQENCNCHRIENEIRKNFLLAIGIVILLAKNGTEEKLN